MWFLELLHGYTFGEYAIERMTSTLSNAQKAVVCITLAVSILQHKFKVSQNEELTKVTIQQYISQSYDLPKEYRMSSIALFDIFVFKFQCEFDSNNLVKDFTNSLAQLKLSREEFILLSRHVREQILHKIVTSDKDIHIYQSLLISLQEILSFKVSSPVADESMKKLRRSVLVAVHDAIQRAGEEAEVSVAITLRAVIVSERLLDLW